MIIAFIVVACVVAGISAIVAPVYYFSRVLEKETVAARNILISTEDGTVNLGQSVRSEKLLYSVCIKVADRKPACEFTTKDKLLLDVKQVMKTGEATALDIKIGVNAAVTYTGENDQKATALIPPHGKFLPAGTTTEEHIASINQLFDDVYQDYKQNFSKM
ncbi:hypothetical protein QE320_gp103 [Pseudomonas phage EM]|uniref:Uncharacterized protein n=1 Tax=Pseudomonas phage EM TaxID=2936914 RepID=A0AAE9HKE1_9CAUD|nr:hypothetical protein QE320_gp103 [Pseudomonas phage EM]UPW35951.1 hypothetical protein EM_166 [Pseudomonas phage EM]